jgi:hypothetical protein
MHVHLAFSPVYYYNSSAEFPLGEAKMSKRIWVTAFLLAVSCSMLFSTLAYAVNDPK